jgi:sulfur carrier protein ThiS
MHPPLHKLPALPSPQRSRSRRERRSDAARKPVLHVVMPGCEVARAEIKPRETVSAFLRRTGWATKDRKYGWQFKKGLPTVLEVNGEPVLRRFWTTTRIAANDSVRFVSYPLGGQGSGAKQVIGLVALVALAAFSGGIASALLGSSASTVLFGSLTAGQALAAGIVAGGALLINALTAPKAGATNAPDSTQDQIYSVQAQGNTAKLGQPLPVWYGRLKTFPDFAATPWGEFVGNDQYLNILLSVGMGSFEYENLYIDDTILWDADSGVSGTFTGTQIAFYEPGATVDLFPTNVDSSAEVTGQQLPDGSGTLPGQYWMDFGGSTPGDWLGGFVANPSGTLVQSIAVDYVLPGGCFTVNTDNNNIGYATVGLTAEYCPCDDAGAPTGSYSTLFSVQRTYASTSPIRDSIKTDVGAGRYLVRLRRDDAGLATQHGSNAIVWAGLRSFLKGANSFPDVATVAIRILATQSTQGSYKFGVLATRKLPVWDGSSFVTQATRNPAWAFLDAVSNAQYGSGLALSKVDFNAVVNFAAGCDTRGDAFDYCFTAATAVPDAFDKILTPARARHFWLGDTVSVVRDEWRDVPSMLLTDREIVRDSTQITFTMLGDEDPDAVIVEYIDQNTWLPAQVQYPPDDQFFTATNAETKRIDGIVSRDQAFRECAFYYLQSIYRRENVQIGTEYEGRAITFGSVLRVQSELPQAYGYGGAVVGVSGNALTLNPAPVWDSGPFYIRLRRPNGKWFGPVVATMGADASIANLSSDDLASVESAQSIALADVLAREDGGEYPSFELGTADSQSKLCVVLSGVPNGDLCTLNLVVDDIRVHATDLGSPPVLPTSQFPTNASVPLIVGLNAKFDQGTAEPVLSASWFPAAGALYYVADVSYDDGASWTQVYEGQANQFTKVVTLAALKLRVQAVGIVRGPYSSLDLDAPTIVIASETVALTSLVEGIKYNVTTLQSVFKDRIDSVEAALSDKIAQVAAKLTTNKEILNQQSWDHRIDLIDRIAVGDDALGASIETIQTVATSTQASLASYQITVDAHLGAIDTSVTTNATALSTLNSSFASYQVTVASLFGVANANISTNANAISSLNSALGSYETTVNAHLTSLDGSVSTINANVTTNATALATLNSAFSSYTTTTNATLGSHTTSISANSSSISTLNGMVASKYSVTLTTDGYATGFGLINGGAGFSTFTIVADKFEIQLPGYNGGAPKPFLTTGTVGGVPSVGLRGDFYLDGTFNVNAIAAGTITSVFLAAQSITAGKMAANSVTAANGAIDALAVKSLNIGDNAVTVPVFSSTTTTYTAVGNSGVYQTIATRSVPVDTTGLAGKQIPILISFTGQQDVPAGNIVARLFANGALVQTQSGGGIATLVLSGICTFTASGGADTIPVYVDWKFDDGGSGYLARVTSESLWAMAAKR